MRTGDRVKLIHDIWEDEDTIMEIKVKTGKVCDILNHQEDPFLIEFDSGEKLWLDGVKLERLSISTEEVVSYITGIEKQIELGKQLVRTIKDPIRQVKLLSEVLDLVNLSLHMTNIKLLKVEE